MESGCDESRTHTSLGEADWKKEIAKVPSAHFVCRL